MSIDVDKIISVVKDRGTWSVSLDGGRIRNDKGECPICAYVNEVLGETRWRLSYSDALNHLAARLGRSPTSAERLASHEMVAAADLPVLYGEARRIRDRLLTGLNVDKS